MAFFFRPFKSFLLMSSIVQVPSVEKCIELFGGIEGRSFHREISKTGFRSASSFREQLQFLKIARPRITVREITKLLGISNNKYYAALENNEKINETPSGPPTRKLLTNDEELQIIKFIYDQQISNDCWTGKNIRLEAAEVFKARTGSIREFTRDWLLDFKMRHHNSIEKVTCTSLDNERSNISIADVDKYISEIEDVMEDPPCPFLLINFDETGFGKRPDKGKRKSVYIIKGCKVPPFWRGETDPQHISVVAAVTDACTDIMPLFLSSRKRLDRDLDDTFFYRRGNYFPTPKGYMNIDSTIFWIENNLKPYVEFVRAFFNQNLRCVVIADGLSSHFHDNVKPSLEKIGNIKMIPLPAHSSHISQVLDVSIFNSFKKGMIQLQVIQNTHHFSPEN